MRVAEADKNNRALLLDAAEAYLFLLEMRARFGLQKQNSGRYVNPKDLSKTERLNLRNAFTVISDIQKVLRVRFKTALLG